MTTSRSRSAFFVVSALTSLSVTIVFLFSNSASASAMCSWLFAPPRMILDARREVSVNPHSAYFIGQHVREENLRTIIEEISGEKPLDEAGCVSARCNANDKSRIREYLNQKISRHELPVYYEFQRRGPVRGEHNERTTVTQILDTGKFNTVIYFLQKARFEFYDRNLSSLNSALIGSLIANIRTPPPSYERFYGVTWGDMRSSAFLEHPVLRERLIAEATEFKNRLQTAEQGARPDGKPAPAEAPEIVNVITEIRGTKHPQQILEVTAHYDTVPWGPGADDNGSGVSAMLEMIRIFKKFPPERTIRFVFTDLEEVGMQGSRLHTKGLLAKNENVISTLVIDTIGYHPKRKDGSAPVYVIELGQKSMHKSDRSYYKTKELIEAIAWQSNRYLRDVRFSVQTVNALPDSADHGQYLSAGLPAALVAAGFHGDLINPGYHKSSDVIGSYNWPFFMGITRVLTESVAVISGARIPIEEYQAILNSVGTVPVNSNVAKEPLLRIVPNDGVPQRPEPKSLIETLADIIFFWRN